MVCFIKLSPSENFAIQRRDYMKKTISALIILGIIFTSSFCHAAFYDIGADTLSWAGEAIDYLSDNKIVNGYEDGSFRPQGNVTRAEFAKMLVLAFLADSYDNSFSDINNHWAENYINSAADYMYSPNAPSFEPDREATRLDIAYAIASVLELSGKGESLSDKFTDTENISPDAYTKLAASVENGIILGYEDSTLRPQNNVTRAEAAVIIYRGINLKTSDIPDAEIPSDSSGTSSAEPDKEENANNPETGNSDADNSNTTGDDHIYTIYPGADLLLVTSVSATNDKNGNDAYRISYRIANSDKLHSSVVPEDTAVAGLKSSMSALRSGDVFIMNTAFHGRIGNLYVLASFGQSIPRFDTKNLSYKKGQYTMAFGKLEEIKISNGKTASLVLNNGTESKTELVMKNTDINIYSNWKKTNNWSIDSLSAIDTEKEDVYVYIRYTNGVSTDIIVSDLIR